MIPELSKRKIASVQLLPSILGTRKCKAVMIHNKVVVEAMTVHPDKRPLRNPCVAKLFLVDPEQFQKDVVGLNIRNAYGIVNGEAGVWAARKINQGLHKGNDPSLSRPRN